MEPANASNNEAEHQEEGIQDNNDAREDAGEGNQVEGVRYQAADLPLNYHQRLAEARARVAQLIGHEEVMVANRGHDRIVWKVIPEHIEEPLTERRYIGVKGIELNRLDREMKFSLLFLAHNVSGLAGKAKPNECSDFSS